MYRHFSYPLLAYFLPILPYNPSVLTLACIIPILILTILCLFLLLAQHLYSPPSVSLLSPSLPYSYFYLFLYFPLSELYLPLFNIRSKFPFPPFSPFFYWYFSSSAPIISLVITLLQSLFHLTTSLIKTHA